MSEYIKLEDAISKMDEWFCEPYTPTQLLSDLPTIDIVNCIECAYLGDDWWCYKHEFTPIPIEDFFCKDGERKDNE